MRKKIDIKPIEDKAKRHTTFTKRRHGLMKKTQEFCCKSDSTAAMIAFSKAGNGYVLAHPHIDIILARYEGAESSSSYSSKEAGTSTSTSSLVRGCHQEEAPPMTTELQKRIAEAIKNGRWDEAVRGLGPQELDQLFAEVENVRRMALEGKIAAAESQSEAGESSPSGGSAND